MKRIQSILVAAVLLWAAPVQAEQPIFDEMPRWDGGWGVQVLQEFLMKQEEDHAPNAGFASAEERIHLTHVQGVYTWDKSIRMTAKVPVVLFAERTVETSGVSPATLQDQGLGDVTLAVPLKQYFNLDGRSGSWTLGPQMLVPGGSDDAYNVYQRDWAGGIYAGYETETFLFHIGGGFDAWYGEGDSPVSSGQYFQFGMNYQIGDLNGYVKLKNYGKYQQDKVLKYSVGPSIYLRITDTVHMQIQTMHDVVAKRFDDKTGRDDSYRIGIGFVY